MENQIQCDGSSSAVKNQRRRIKTVLKWLMLGYLTISSLIGTGVIGLFIFWPIVLLGYNAMAPAPMPVLLPNGFYFSPDWDTPGVNNNITDKDRREVIASDVRRIMWHNDWVYGYRLGVADEIYYFICKYGDDCSGSQNYSDTEFKELLERHNLPQFDREKAENYDKLLWEQDLKGIDTGYGFE